MKLITDITAGAILSGWFELDDRRVSGTLLVNSHETSLYLRDDAFFHVDETLHRDLHGTLLDLTKVTLIDCVIRSLLGSMTRYDQTYHTAEVTPHFIVSGHRHLEPAEQRWEVVGARGQ